MINEPIIALATPPLKSALAVIRLSGEGVFAITDRFFSRPVSALKERSVLPGTFSFEGSPIDQIVLLAYPGPHTMTGEDVVEICCHGSMVIVSEIVKAYLSCGVRYATAGEFTSRAFYHGKMDLVEAEAVNDLINATTAEAKNAALLSLNGQVSPIVQTLKDDISALLALVEVGIDFPEYDEEEKIDGQKLMDGCLRIRALLRDLVQKGEQSRVYREGVNLALVGKPNVGKSSLLNALLEQNKAIVSDVPGTTRDVVEGSLSIQGIPVRLLDTAGIRESEDLIERLGVEKSKESIQEADLVLFVREAGKELDDEERSLQKLVEGKRVLTVFNKTDLYQWQEENGIYVSAISGDVRALKDAIVKAWGVEENAYKVPSFGNARELGILKRIDAEIAEVIEGVENGVLLDLLSAILQNAYNDVRELLGEDATHDLTDEIFSRFCVGK